MAKIRRVVRKVEPSAAHYFDEQLWPVQIGIVVLGGFLMGVSLAYQPLSGVVWYRTAWPSLIGIPLIIGAAMAALFYVDNRLFRRSLQLSLVLCAIVHVAMVAQMLNMRLFAGAYPKERGDQTLIEKRPQKIVPEYHPTQLVPEEDRPRQDFEKPVEAQAPEPMRQPEQIVRQPTEQEQSPSQPQPIPIPEQQPTTEPNVVNRPRPNEVAPRLAAQQSRLSRQVEPSRSRVSEQVDVPAAVPQRAKAAEPRPSAAPVERQTAEAAPAERRRAEPTAKAAPRESELVRRASETAPSSKSSARAATNRTLADAAATQQTPIAAAQATSESKPPSEIQPSRTTTARQDAAPSAARPNTERGVAADTTTAPSSAAMRRAAVESNPTTANNTTDPMTPRPRLPACPLITELPRQPAPTPTT
jgi:hypothetical protein